MKISFEEHTFRPVIISFSRRNFLLISVQFFTYYSLSINFNPLPLKWYQTERLQVKNNRTVNLKKKYLTGVFGSHAEVYARKREIIVQHYATEKCFRQ